MTGCSDSSPCDCGCCSGIDLRTPRAITNRPGLSAIAYRVGLHGDFLASMEARLSSSDFPVLSLLRTRDSDDFSVALLDAFATVADVLTFYQERIAAESYLRTASERRSLVEMARLLGHRPKPGVAAETYLAFTLEEAEGAPDLVDLAAGIQVQSVPGPDEKPQTFETVEPIEARKEWNALVPQLSRPHLPKAGSTDCVLAGANLNLKPGDALLFVGDEVIQEGSRDNWDHRIVTSVRVDATRGFTSVAWEAGLGSSAHHVAPAKNPQVHVFRRRAAVYGHNAPKWATMPQEFRNAYPGGACQSEWPSFLLSSAAGTFVDLDAVYPQVVAGGWLILVKADYTELYRVKSVSELSREEFAMSAKVSRVELAGENYDLFSKAVRTTSVAIANEQLAFVEQPIEVPVFGAVVALGRRSTALHVGQPLAFSGKRARLAAVADRLQLVLKDGTKRDLAAGNALEILTAPERVSGGKPVPMTPQDLSDALQSSAATLRWHLRDRDGADGALEASSAAVALAPAAKEAPVVSEIAFIDSPADAVASDTDRTTVRLSAALANCYERTSLVINANVARATHGETVHQVLGSGDAGRAHQSFALKHTPLTFVGATNELGAVSTLEVRVDDVKWTEARTLFGAGERDPVYSVRIDDDATAVVRFGDGRRGERLTTGKENVRAVYRKGIGAAGNVAAGQLSQLLTRPLGLKAATNPLPAAGGADADAAAALRRNLPLGMRTLGRAVSVRDYEDFARAFSGIGKAQAEVLDLRAGRTIFVTVGADDGRRPPPDSPTLSRLVGALLDAGDPFVRVAIGAYTEAFFRVRLKIGRDPARERDQVFAAVRSALRDAFSFDRREFGQAVALSEVVAVAAGATGVVAVDVDAFYRGSVETVEERIGAAATQVAAGGNAVPSELLLLSPEPIALEEMP